MTVGMMYRQVEKRKDGAVLLEDENGVSEWVRMEPLDISKLSDEDAEMVRRYLAERETTL